MSTDKATETTDNKKGLTQDEARIVMEFLKRTPLKGEEVPAFSQVCIALQKIVQG